MPPKLNRRRALFVLSKIDEILASEKELGQADLNAPPRTPVERRK